MEGLGADYARRLADRAAVAPGAEDRQDRRRQDRAPNRSPGGDLALEAISAAIFGSRRTRT